VPVTSRERGADSSWPRRGRSNAGALALHARIHRSLRLAGVRRAAARGERSSGITAREREVLALVGAGLSNAEIARRLGIGRPTVARLVTTASVRLGADSRLQAAVLAAQG